ncbi:fatty acid hydroxylase superfamily domain-containing protein [Ditylenchus destructor]|nr:fatty acid hydroxylase superfamily domain-containing protein [Ditylenchus destructor]
MDYIWSLINSLISDLSLTNLRHIFYLITPYETSVYTVEEVPKYNIQICVGKNVRPHVDSNHGLSASFHKTSARKVSTWWITLMFLELGFLKLSGREERLALNDSMTSIFAGMLSECFKFGGRSIAIFAYVFIWNNFRLIELPWDSAFTWLFCFLFQDFAYYLGHRAIHECGFFWGFHTIHHSSEYYNLSTALRQAAIQDAGLAAYDVLQAFCIPPPIFLVHRYFSEIFQFWMHTSLLGSFGPLGYVFNTPSHHRVHHGRNAYCIDRNFGGVLIIWDRMFHTFEAERADDPPVYGLISNERTFNQLWLQFHSFKDLLFDKWRKRVPIEGTKRETEEVFPSFTEKLKALFYPPGYFPGVEVYPFFHWFSLKDHTAEFTLKLVFFVCTMQIFGAFFDGRSYASFLEIIRCVSVPAFYATKLLLDGDGVSPNGIFLVTIYFSSALLWIGWKIGNVKNKSKVSSTDEKKIVILTHIRMQPTEIKIQISNNSTSIIAGKARME